MLDDDQRNEIERARATVTTTMRPTVPELEAVMHTPFPVLDHGFIRVVDYMGDDSAVVQAARVSYGRGTRKVSEDRGLIRYLMRHWHTTPFEMCEIKLHVKLPIFVARQWIRHRTANVNEYSARYSILDREFYIPEPDQIAPQSAANKQGRAEPVDTNAAEAVRALLRGEAERAYDNYLWMLNDEGGNHEPSRPGVARELARIGLGLNTYTQWYWKADLHNLLRFLRLRADPHAQYEIRAYAEVMLDIVKRWVPMAYEAFVEYQMNTVSLSATAADIVRRALSGEAISFETSGLSRREWDELDAALGITNQP
ncbi:MAG: FAD-dependent thymidylate synthase [Sphingomonas sp.]|uniref:FAD-dependent thymidylate synthase n=1 Tax=Sphingomonas sp. TaxID=28214 RepID=UPI001ACC6C80|nr:FAD-dependent thymidylate synthase [Sphingomonas sp.]MBN8808440.1 FAD-dependent thymidylate synthase [Sphingomonas sp.]